MRIDRLHLPVATATISTLVVAIFYRDPRAPYEAGLPLPARREDAWWRYFTSVLCHSDEWHLWGNMVLLVVAGGVIECMHDGLTFLGVFWIGGSTGALAEAAAYEAYAPAIFVGMSPAVFALVGAYAAHLLLNWDETPFRGTILVGLLVYVGVTLTHYWVAQETGIAHMSHIGGAAQGVLIGSVVIKNVRVRPYEHFLRAGGFAFACLGIFHTAYRIGQQERGGGGTGAPLALPA